MRWHPIATILTSRLHVYTIFTHNHTSTAPVLEPARHGENLALAPPTRPLSHSGAIQGQCGPLGDGTETPLLIGLGSPGDGPRSPCVERPALLCCECTILRSTNQWNRSTHGLMMPLALLALGGHNARPCSCRWQWALPLVLCVRIQPACVSVHYLTWWCTCE